jgi:hypothetical protein
MAMMPRNLPRKPVPPKPAPVPTYTLDQMRAFGWIYDGPITPGGAIPRIPDPRIPSGLDPRIPRKDETS